MFGKNELINSLQKRTPQYSAQKSPKITDFWAFLRFILRGPFSDLDRTKLKTAAIKQSFIAQFQTRNHQ
jgi:hypothetical protein